MKQRTSIHFVGVGGAGMSALAQLAHELGHTVSGSDSQASETTAQLQRLGVKVFIGHDAQHIAGAQRLVASTAIAVSNPELQAARALGLPVLARAAFLAELMGAEKSGKPSIAIAIAGTHGKTTTTSLAATVLMEAGVDPSFVIGGRLHSLGANARLGQGPHFVAEADESDASFLMLNPQLLVVTNIDADHLETYGHSLAQLYQAFIEFVHRLPADGCAVLCSDDPGVQAVLPALQRRVVTYGLDASAQLQALQVQALSGLGMRFVARQTGHADLELTLNLSGTHNVLNALAVLALAREMQLPDAAVTRALQGFAGVGRRFDVHGDLPAADGGSFTLVDDYGHHPVELAAVIAAARGAYPGRRLLLAFQPHRYTRTRDCFEEFVRVLQQADVLLLCEVYAAGEAAIAGADAKALAERLGQVAGSMPQVCEVAALPQQLLQQARSGDIVITAGAGSIGSVPAQLLAAVAGKLVQEASA